MSEAQTNEHDVAIAEAAVDATEAQAEAAVAIAETQAEAAVEAAEVHAEAAEEWRTQIDDLRTSHEAERHRQDSALNALQTELAEVRALLLSIQSPQETPQENPENPENAPSEAVLPEAAEEVAEAAEEPAKPERKRAHRWI